MLGTGGAWKAAPERNIPLGEELRDKATGTQNWG